MIEVSHQGNLYAISEQFMIALNKRHLMIATSAIAIFEKLFSRDRNF